MISVSLSLWNTFCLLKLWSDGSTPRRKKKENANNPTQDFATVSDLSRKDVRNQRCGRRERSRIDGTQPARELSKPVSHQLSPAGRMPQAGATLAAYGHGAWRADQPPAPWERRFCSSTQAPWKTITPKRLSPFTLPRQSLFVFL